MAARLHNVSQDDATRSTGVLGHRRQQHLRHSRPTSDRRQALDDSWLERSSICGVTRSAPTASSVFVEDVVAEVAMATVLVGGGGFGCGRTRHPSHQWMLSLALRVLFDHQACEDTSRSSTLAPIAAST